MEEIKHKITFDGKDYEVNEPSIKTWSKLAMTSDLLDEKELALDLISDQTGLSRGQLLQCDWFDLFSVSQNIMEFLTKCNDGKFYRTFTHDNIEYEFVDLSKLSFGHFVDIDSYLGRTDIEKLQGLNYYMALLYREVGSPNVHDTGKTKQRGEVFNNLPVKYYFGANLFFLILEKNYRGGMRGYLTLSRMWYWMKVTMIFPLGLSLVGIQQSLRWLKTMSQKLIRLRKYLWSWH